MNCTDRQEFSGKCTSLPEKCQEDFWLSSLLPGDLVLGQPVRVGKCLLGKCFHAVSKFQTTELLPYSGDAVLNFSKNEQKSHGNLFFIKYSNIFSEKERLIAICQACWVRSLYWQLWSPAGSTWYFSGPAAAPLWPTASGEAPKMKLICSILFEKSNRLCLTLSRPEIA